jgi:transposase InsO family protein
MNVIKDYWTKVGSFMSADKLHKILKKDGHNISLAQVTKFLKNQLTYQLHKPVQKRFPRRPIIVSGPNVMWDVDLLDLKEFRGSNFRYRYILTVIDVFSRKAYAEALTNKSASTTATAFEKIINLAKPIAIRTDHGNEFKREFSKLLKINKIDHIWTSSPEIKANYVERFHRTFRDKLRKHMTYYSTQNWTKIYKNIVASYNNTPHKGIKNLAPNDVNSSNVGELLEYMLSQQKFSGKGNFKVGDVVRITTLKKTFAKASKETYTDELFRIKDTSLGTYKIEDLTGEPIIGTFYSQELQLAEPDALVHKRVGKVINKGKNQYKVHFKNWPNKFDTILDKKQLKFYEIPK